MSALAKPTEPRFKGLNRLEVWTAKKRADLDAAIAEVLAAWPEGTYPVRRASMQQIGPSWPHHEAALTANALIVDLRGPSWSRLRKATHPFLARAEW